MEKESKLKLMEELDAKIEKINYDLAGLESRKKEMEENKFSKQQEIDKLEQEKKEILAKTDKMNRLQKVIYIIVSSKTDLKQVELINAKISENTKEKDNIQNKIDIQNKLYSDTIKEKESCIEERKQLYVDKINVNSKAKENTRTSEIQDLAQIYGITMQYQNNSVMQNLKQIVEQKINQYLGANSVKQDKVEQKQEEDEME